MPVTVILLGDGPAPGLPPDVEILHVADRREGWKRASGSRIAVFDTRYSAGPDWTAGLHAQGTVGGVVLPGKDLAWSGWVYYVIEYGWRRQLVAGNVCLDRSLLPDEFDPGPGAILKEMAVHLENAPNVTSYVRERFTFSYRWGRARVSPFAAPLRIFLPFLVCWRSPWWRKPSTLPGVIFMSLVMAAGEIFGGLSPRDATLKD
jgi:hypothetical protein